MKPTADQWRDLAATGRAVQGAVDAFRDTLATLCGADGVPRHWADNLADASGTLEGISRTIQERASNEDG